MKYNIDSKRGFRPQVGSFIKFSNFLLMMFGIIYTIVQFIHPDGQIMNVNTRAWFITSMLTLLMSLFAILGLLGLYAKQVKESGWMGLLGVTLWCVFWLTSLIFSFIEAFVLPLIAATSPEFVSGIMGLFDSVESSISLGVFPFIAIFSGIFYILGGLVFGVATIRAKVLPKLPTLLFTVSSLITVLASFVPYPINRVFAIPMAISLFWLGATQFFLNQKIND